MAYFGGLKIQFENRILLKTRVRFDVLQKFFLKTGVKIAMLKNIKQKICHRRSIVSVRRSLPKSGPVRKIDFFQTLPMNLSYTPFTLKLKHVLELFC